MSWNVELIGRHHSASTVGHSAVVDQFTLQLSHLMLSYSSADRK